jgi:hypothetical protein
LPVKDQALKKFILGLKDKKIYFETTEKLLEQYETQTDSLVTIHKWP